MDDPDVPFRRAAAPHAAVPAHQPAGVAAAAEQQAPRAIGHNIASPGTLARGLVGYKGPLQQPLGQPSSFMLRKGDMALSQSFKVGPPICRAPLP